MMLIGGCGTIELAQRKNENAIGISHARSFDSAINDYRKGMEEDIEVRGLLISASGGSRKV